MYKGFIFILIGIGVIIYNKMSTTSMLVLKGTKLDYGYFAIGLGVLFLIIGAISSSSNSEDPQKEKLRAAIGETKKKFEEGASEEEVTEWLVAEKGLGRELAASFAKTVASSLAGGGQNQNKEAAGPEVQEKTVSAAAPAEVADAAPERKLHSPAPQFCTKCGVRSVSETAKYCQGCGAAFST